MCTDLFYEHAYGIAMIGWQVLFQDANVGSRRASWHHTYTKATRLGRGSVAIKFCTFDIYKRTAKGNVAFATGCLVESCSAGTSVALCLAIAPHVGWRRQQFRDLHRQGDRVKCSGTFQSTEQRENGRACYWSVHKRKDVNDGTHTLQHWWWWQQRKGLFNFKFHTGLRQIHQIQGCYPREYRWILPPPISERQT